MVGLSTIGSISLGMVLVAGKKRVPNPAAGITAFLTLFELIIFGLMFALFNFAPILRKIRGQNYTVDENSSKPTRKI
jgi:hypothetical protein